MSELAPDNEASADTIKLFLHGQVTCWNAGDKDGFFKYYREAAPAGLNIDYVGQPQHDAWLTLGGMWAQQNANVRIEVVACIVNGSEAACHHRNHFRTSDGFIDTMELYRFFDGQLEVRYFVARH